jgi:hypothetical protein
MRYGVKSRGVPLWLPALHRRGSLDAYTRSVEHPFQVVLHHHSLERGLVEDPLEDVGVVVHAADYALDEGVGEDELEVFDGVGSGLGY